MLMKTKDEKINDKRQELEDVLNYVLPQIRFEFVKILHEKDFGITRAYRFGYIRSDGRHRYCAHQTIESLATPKKVFDEELNIVLEMLKQTITDEYLYGDQKQRKDTLKTGFYKELIHFEKKDLNKLLKKLED